MDNSSAVAEMADGDERYPMRRLPCTDEALLYRLLPRPLPPVAGRTGEQLWTTAPLLLKETLARDAARQYLEEGAC